MTSIALTVVLVTLVAIAVRPRPPVRGRRRRTSARRRRHPAAQTFAEVRRFGRRPARVETADVAAWCDALAREVRGGVSLREAVATAEPPEPLAQALRPVMLALSRGVALEPALAEADSKSPSLDLALVMLRACATYGGPAAEPIDRAASALRQRHAVDAERRTNSAQARMSAMVMTLVPIAMLSVLTLTSGAVRTTLTTPIGQATVTLGALLNGGGWAWMRRMIAGPM